MDWSKPVTLVIALPAQVLPATLERIAAVPDAPGGPSGRTLVRGGWVALHGMGSGLRTMIRNTWGNIVQTPTTADALRALLTQAGVAADAMAEYVSAWQQGAALLVVPGVPASLCAPVQAAMRAWQATSAAVDVHSPTQLPANGRGGIGFFGRATITGPVVGGHVGTLTYGDIHPDSGPFRHVDLTGRDGAMVLGPPSTGGAEGALRVGPPVAPLQVQRYISVDAPTSVLPEQTFEVSVQLTRERTAKDPQAPQMEVWATSVAGQDTGAPPVKVQIYADNFDISGSTRAVLDLPAEGDSPLARFQLRPSAGTQGAQEISLTFIQGADILANRTLTVWVGQAAAMPVAPIRPTLPAAADAMVFPTGATVAEADLTLFIELKKVPELGLRFSYLWPQKGVTELQQVASSAADSPDGRKEVAFMPLNQVEKWVQERYDQLSAAAKFPQGSGMPQSQIDAAERKLAELGENLYLRLPRAFKDFYQTFAPLVRTILIYSTEPWIPWEIMKPSNTDAGDDLPAELCDFLCARFVVARWLTYERLRHAPRMVWMREICPIVPPSNLAATITESQYLQDLPAAWKPALIEVYKGTLGNKDDVLAAMSRGDINLFHIATHGRFQPDRDRNAVIQIGTDSFSVENLIGSPVVAGLSKSAPLVFMNACHSDRKGTDLSEPDGWVNRFLRFGCSGFIGTNWEVQDEQAAEFAKHFYDRLRVGATFGVAFQQARLALRTKYPGNSTWLAYVLYAHPNGTLQGGAAPS